MKSRIRCWRELMSDTFPTLLPHGCPARSARSESRFEGASIRPFPVGPQASTPLRRLQTYVRRTLVSEHAFGEDSVMAGSRGRRRRLVFVAAVVAVTGLGWSGVAGG